jgi:hypothetical protein
MNNTVQVVAMVPMAPATIATVSGSARCKRSAWMAAKTRMALVMIDTGTNQVKSILGASGGVGAGLWAIRRDCSNPAARGVLKERGGEVILGT